MNNTIRVPKGARIVSLVPSQTELLHFLGCEEEVVGITKFCIHPKSWFDHKERVGGTKNVDFKKIEALRPDLIIANKEENSKEDIEKLQKLYTVYISDITTVEDAFEMIEQVGELVGKSACAAEFIKRVKDDFERLPVIDGTVLYFIWKNPYMVVGPNTFIGQLIEKLGMKNVIVNPEIRYVELSETAIKELNPAYILLSTEPYPFKKEHIIDFATHFNTKALLVDGEMFSWYGSRMGEMKDYFRSLATEFNYL